MHLVVHPQSEVTIVRRPAPFCPEFYVHAWRGALDCAAKSEFAAVEPRLVDALRAGDMSGAWALWNDTTQRAH
eukprot:15471059-Alexandrium_andersonii.AAC.1